ncbi:hypothetical protein VIBNIAM115_430016 [Vibrio nigripulchritudo AM115]|nr:hypothetical protein VIBNIAM115_430016 [Vibrio nigripulchritudo AM115]
MISRLNCIQISFAIARMGETPQHHGFMGFVAIITFVGGLLC